MKLKKVLEHLHTHKCFLFREGRKHSVYYNRENEKISTVPRHRDIDDFLANKICKDLGIPKIK